MKKIKRRTISLIILAAALAVGVSVFVIRWAVFGGAWATHVSNQNVYTSGILTTGRIFDRNGVLLAGIEGNARTYAENSDYRKSTLHAVGDAAGNIGTSALKAFSDKLVGYNLLTGTYSLSGEGNDLYLAIDAALNAAAYKALAGRSGTVAVYNYKTGEMLCMVSNPSYDPVNPPEISEGDSRYEGVYINRFLSASYVPGSIFKLVTTAAAIDNIDDLFERTYTCTGSIQIDGDTINCSASHGTMFIEEALAVSCNVAYAQLSTEMGANVLAEYANKLGLTESIKIDGIGTAAGSFDKAENRADLAWSGIGQYNDLVNPAAMLTLMGAIANDGVPVMPRLIKKTATASGFPTGLHLKKTGTRLLDESTAKTLAEMMSNNVTLNYGKGNFPGLDLCAKTGTAEVGGALAPHSWFVGFIRNEGYPLAFVVLVENGGSGIGAAAAVANTVLQAAISDT